MRQPPTSTLFPYTTLFRSERLPVGVGTADGLDDDVGTEPAGQLLQPDRKSTRLNSSHMSISYAVFCLKKKKISARCFFRLVKSIRVVEFNLRNPCCR